MANTMKLLMLSAAVILAPACSGEHGEVQVGGVAAEQTLPEGLSISSARISLAELELEGGTEEDDRDAESKAVELELGGAPILVADADAGTYHTLAVEVSGILVEGTVRGAAFSFTSSIALDAVLALDPEIDVPANGSAAVSVRFDVVSWFENDDGSPLDPNNAADHKAIEARMIASMTASSSQLP